MNVIYEPKGKAKEYSELACNLYSGCNHKCRYCYCPNIRHMSLAEWSSNPKPRSNILKKLENDAKNLKDKSKEILFCFMSDPYQSEESAKITRNALLICEKYNLKAQILTKAGERAVNDFDILKRNNWKFGSTISFFSESLREYWEPDAPSIQSRINAIKKAKEIGIYTWISIEPVTNTKEALKVIGELYDYIDFWKIGKLNHFPEIERKINWKEFALNVIKKLENKKYYIKNDLKKYLNS